MSISDWQSQDGTTPLVAMVSPPEHESADVELGGRLAEDLAALTRVLLGPDVPDSLVARYLPPPVPVVEPVVALEPVAPVEPVEDHDAVDEATAEPSLALDDPVTAVQQLVSGEPADAAETFVAPPVVEIEPLYTEPVAEFVAPPVVEVEPLVPLTPAAPAATPRQLIDELSSLDL